MAGQTRQKGLIFELSEFEFRARIERHVFLEKQRLFFSLNYFSFIVPKVNRGTALFAKINFTECVFEFQISLTIFLIYFLLRRYNYSSQIALTGLSKLKIP